MKKSFAEQIRSLENTRAAKAAAMSNLAQKVTDEGRTMDEAEAEQFDTIEGEISQIDKDLSRLRTLERINSGKAQPVTQTEGDPDPAATGTRQRGPTIIVAPKDRDEKFKGQNFTRMVIAKAAAHILGGGIKPSEVAEQRWGKSNPTLVQWVRAMELGRLVKANEILPAGENSSAPGTELALVDQKYTGDFIELLQAATIFDRLPLRVVPANIAIKGTASGATGYWVGEGKAIPASAPDTNDVSLTRLKVAAIAAITKELIKDASPDAEQWVQGLLVDASTQRVDGTFFSTTAASSGVSPAGILNGLSAKSTVGSGGEGVRGDVAQLYADFISAKNASGLVFCANTGTAKNIGLIASTFGNVLFPTVGAQGGTLLGDPIYTGDNVNAAHLILLKPSDIYKIGDDGVEISVSDVATLEMSSSPTGAAITNTAASANLQNLWQQEMLGIKVVRSINYAKRRSSAVAYVSDADYNPLGSP